MTLIHPLFPTSFRAVLTYLALAGVAIVAIFTATRGGLILGLVLIGAAAYLTWVAGYRVDRWLREAPLLGGRDE